MRQSVIILRYKKYSNIQFASINDESTVLHLQSISLLYSLILLVLHGYVQKANILVNELVELSIISHNQHSYRWHILLIFNLCLNEGLDNGCLAAYS